MSEQPDGEARIAVSAEAQLRTHIQMESFYRNRILVLEELLRRGDQIITQQSKLIEGLQERLIGVGQGVA